MYNSSTEPAELNYFFDIVVSYYKKKNFLVIWKLSDEEILETFKNHHSDILGKVKLILLIAITAIVRKLITLDIKYSEYHLVFGISVLILSLCVGYYFLNKKDKSI